MSFGSFLPHSFFFPPTKNKNDFPLLIQRSWIEELKDISYSYISGYRNVICMSTGVRQRPSHVCETMSHIPYLVVFFFFLVFFVFRWKWFRHHHELPSQDEFKITGLEELPKQPRLFTFKRPRFQSASPWPTADGTGAKGINRLTGIRQSWKNN